MMVQCNAIAALPTCPHLIHGVHAMATAHQSGKQPGGRVGWPRLLDHTLVVLYDTEHLVQGAWTLDVSVGDIIVLHG